MTAKRTKKASDSAKKAPGSAKKASDSARKPKSTQDRVFDKFKRKRPTKAGVPKYEVSRSTESVLSSINYVLKTQLASFDDVAGGFPFGRIVELFGLPSCGKSALCQLIAHNTNQKMVARRKSQELGVKAEYELMDPDSFETTVVYIDNESSLDGEKMVINGIPLDIVIGRTDTTGQVFQLIEDAIDVIREQEEEYPDKTQFMVVIVDTLAGTSTKEELESSWDKRDFPRQAKELREGFRILTNEIQRHNICLVCVNQTSENFNKKIKKANPFASAEPDEDDYRAPGGGACAFFATFRIFLYAMNTNYKLNRAARFSDGITIGFQTIKGRVKQAKRRGRLVLITAEENGGFKDDLSMLEQLIYLRYVEYNESDKSFVLKFKKRGITTATFKDDTQTRRTPKEPRIFSRGEWPAFYAAHSEDIDLLWARAIKEMFTTKYEKEALEREAAASELADIDDYVDVETEVVSEVL